MTNREAAIIGAIAMMGVAGVSYLLALAGEPQAAWFWRDVLGVTG